MNDLTRYCSYREELFSRILKFHSLVASTCIPGLGKVNFVFSSNWLLSPLVQKDLVRGLARTSLPWFDYLGPRIKAFVNTYFISSWIVRRQKDSRRGSTATPGVPIRKWFMGIIVEKWNLPENTPSNSTFYLLGKTGRKVPPTFNSNFLSVAPQSFLFLVKEMEKSLYYQCGAQIEPCFLCTKMHNAWLITNALIKIGVPWSRAQC